MKYLLSKYLFRVLLVLILPISGFAQPVVHFPKPVSTGFNCSILIPKSVHPTINGIPMNYGDEIGVFNSDGICCGARSWNGSLNRSIAVFGEALSPVYIPGMRNAEPFLYRIWSVAYQYEFTLYNITYQSGNGLYSTNSIQVISVFEVTGTHPIKNAPLLISPANSSYSIPLNTNLTWHKFNNSNLYQIQISNISDFSKMFYDNNQIQDTTYSGVFLLDSFYFWRVRAEVNTVWSDWSDVWVFTTGNPISDIGHDLNTSQLIDFNIYPNPCKEKMNIIWNDESETPRNIFLMNSLGENVLKFSDSDLINKLKNNFEIDLSLLNSGIYYCVFETNKNKYIRKLIIIK